MATPLTCSARMEPGRITVAACGRDWTLLRPADLESLWNAMTDAEFTEDERLPYWVELWPASLALAAFLQRSRDRVQGKSCLDLGCGLGFTAIVAASFGARVVAVDYEAAALIYAGKNAGVNEVPSPVWTVMDWRKPAVKKHAFDFIWGGDIMYERRFVTPVLDFLEHSLAPGGSAWVAEPGRNVYDHFKAALLQRGWTSKKVAEDVVEPLHVQKNPVRVNLWELSRAL